MLGVGVEAAPLWIVVIEEKSVQILYDKEQKNRRYSLEKQAKIIPKKIGMSHLD